ncbi:lipase [Corynebacterium diphtheriae]|nr:lipase [Corynebacterium diphtheriae]CAB0886043.1 lipase [Corynebacterium diphtheriae]
MHFKYNKLAFFLIPKFAAQSTVLFSQLDTFYSSIPDANNTDTGTVPSEQELPIGVLDSLVKAKRIAYSSTHPNGHHTPTTATIFTPTSPWRGLGPRPAALLAPGIQGAGDQCAPSKLLTLGAEYKMLPATLLLSRGWTVVNTHTPEVDENAPLLLWGYSQGGGAAAAAEMHASYAPDVNIRGGFAGGVPANLLSTTRALEGSPLLGALGYAIAGMYETHPEIRGT